MHPEEFLTGIPPETNATVCGQDAGCAGLGAAGAPVPNPWPPKLEGPAPAGDDPNAPYPPNGEAAPC